MKELDFTLLDNIKTKEEPKAFILTPSDKGRAMVEIERQQDIIKRARSAWSGWSIAINKSELYRSELLKLAKSGESKEVILLLAIDCIYSITGDKVFYNQITDILKAAAPKS